MSEPVRIVSLAAAGTEIVCALGAGGSLVGRSHECDNPDWAQKLPACTRPAFDMNLSSAEIDAEVRRRMKTGEPLYHVDRDQIRALKPDLIIAQAHCEVCAVTPNDVCGVPGKIVPLHAGNLQGIFDDIATIAEAIHRPGAKLIDEMRRQMENISAAVRHLPAPTVIMLEWISPLFSMGNWGPELMELANAKLLLAHKGEYSRAISWEMVRDADPDHLIISPCGFDLQRTMREISTLQSLPGWFELRAVRENHVALADGNRYFNRSGTTITGTLQIIAEILHGYRDDSCRRGRDWLLYSSRG